MAPTRYALARDDDGNTLWRTEEDFGQDRAFELTGPGMEESARISVYAYLDTAMGKIRVEDIDYYGAPMPRSWVLWLFFEVFEASFSARLALADGSLIVPRKLEILSWDDLDLHLEAAGLLEQHQILEQPLRLDVPAMRKIRSILVETFEWMGLRVDEHRPGARAIIAEWTPQGVPRSELSVWLRKEEAADERHVAYSVARQKNTITGRSLSEVLRKSEMWVPGQKWRAWVEEHTEDPIWLFDPDLLEAYALLDTPSPLIAPWASFTVWAEEHGLQSA